MKIKPGIADPTFSAYVEMMATELRKQPLRPKILLPEGLSSKEKEAAILAMQAPSTRRTLERPKSQDAAWLSRPIPIEARIATKPEDMAKFERKISLDEYRAFNATRGHRNSLGQSEVSGASLAARERAINAFIFSRPAKLTDQERQRIHQIAPYSPPPPLPPKEPSWLQRVYQRFFGKKPAHTGTGTERWGWSRGNVFENLNKSDAK